MCGKLQINGIFDDQRVGERREERRYIVWECEYESDGKREKFQLAIHAN